MIKLIINLFFAGFLFVGVYSIAAESIMWALVYVVLLILSFVLIGLSYCAKCSACQKTCAHPQIGILRKILPNRDTSQYKLKDYMGLVPYVIVAVLLPQYWLWSNKWLLTIYWAQLAIVFLGIVGILCKRCENRFCKMNRNPKFQSASRN
jgi:hypothetical protein